MSTSQFLLYLDIFAAAIAQSVSSFCGFAITYRLTLLRSCCGFTITMCTWTSSTCMIFLISFLRYQAPENKEKLNVAIMFCIEEKVNLIASCNITCLVMLISMVQKHIAGSSKAVRGSFTLLFSAHEYVDVPSL